MNVTYTVVYHRHIHLHIISSDLNSPSLKVKRHYNSFHPELGFFLHLDEVLSWFDAAPSYFENVRLYDCLDFLLTILPFF